MLVRIDRLFFTVVAVPLDFLAVYAAGLLAWLLRLSPGFREFRPVVFDLAFEDYAGSLFLAGIFTVFAIAFMGLYRFPKPEYGPFGVTLRLVLSTLVTLSGVALLMFLKQDLFGSRFLVLAGWIFATAFLMIERTALYALEDWLARHLKVGLKRAVVIGDDEISEKLTQAFSADPALGYVVVHRELEPDVAAVRSAVKRIGVDAVVIADINYSKEALRHLIDYLNEEHIDILLVPNFLQTLTTNTTAVVIAGVPVIELKRTPLAGWGRVAKRVVDLLGAAFGIVLFSVPMLAIAVLIKLTDPKGPVIYRNRRAGQRGKPFDTLKFRSMEWKYCVGPGTPGHEAALKYELELAAAHSKREGPVWKVMNDPRRTRVGRFIEKTSLDELPQFFNVLLGEMSLVGPRPHMVEQVAKYEAHHKRVLAIKPGITGLSQISGRSDLDFEDEVRLDTHYIEHWSVWLDFKIILLTPFIVLFQRHRA